MEKDDYGTGGGIGAGGSHKGKNVPNAIKQEHKRYFQKVHKTLE